MHMGLTVDGKQPAAPQRFETGNSVHDAAYSHKAPSYTLLISLLRIQDA